MHISDDGAALALQPEDPGEKTALTRLRAIFRRATQYRLPGPYWVNAAEFSELDATGRDALVVQDGASGSDKDDGENAIGVRVDRDTEYGSETMSTDPISEGFEA